MVMAVEREKKKRGKTLDSLLLLGASLLVAVAGTATFWFADHYHINELWLFGLPVAAIFFAVVGWGYRKRLRSPAFVLFFAVWTAVHVVVFLLVEGYLGLLYYIPAMLLEVWVGYMLAILWFGPPPDKGIR